MNTYICKCGRKVTKSTNADNTGNRDTADCTGCPYLMPWGSTAWDSTRHAVVTDIQGYECRISPELSYITEAWGSADDKCTMQINSLDFDFLERISNWIYEHFPDGELSGSFRHENMRACEFVAQGRYRMSISCAQNKKGMAAKAYLLNTFFDVKSKTRLDMSPGDEKQLILNKIAAGKAAAKKEDIHLKNPNERCPLQDDCGRTCKFIHNEKDCDYYHNNCLPGMDISGQEVNNDQQDNAISATPFMSRYTSTCPYFIGVMPSADNPDKLQLHCRTRSDPYNIALYDCDCGSDYTQTCRLYWIKQIEDDIGHVPPRIREGRVENMRLFYEEKTSSPADAEVPTQDLSTADATCLGADADFDYSGLNDQTIETLHSAEKIILNARKDYIVKVADAVGMAHDELVANRDEHNNQHTENTFIQWCASVGLKKDTAYRLLQVSNLLSSSTPNEQQVLEQASPSLLYAAAKPSAPSELVQGVKDGDITTHKQYQDLLAENQTLKRDKLIAQNEADAAGLKATASNNLAAKFDTERQELRKKVKELESRPIDVAVQQPDPAEIERLVQEKAQRITAEIRGELQSVKAELEESKANKIPVEGVFEFDDVVNFAADCASIVRTQIKSFLATVGLLTAGEMDSASAELRDALTDGIDDIESEIEQKEDCD